MRRLLLLLAALVLVTPACSFLGAAPAATVGDVEITTESVDDEMQAIRSNTRYTEGLEQQYGLPTQGDAGEGTFASAFVAQLLAFRIYHEIIDQDLAERGVAIEDDVLDDLRDEMQQGFEQLGADAFDGFPEEYTERLVRQQAIVETVENMFRNEIGDDERAFFDENPDEFVEICVSHVLVGLLENRTPGDAQADAVALKQRIDDGEDFADIATNESDDPGASAQGGSLGCGSRSTLQFDPLFEAAAFELREGQVSDPVQTRFGAHLIQVTERTAPDYADVADIVEQVMGQVLNERFNHYILDVICASDVDVNPRYGTWTQDNCTGIEPSIPTIEPPEGPVTGEPEAPAFGS